MIEPTRMFSHEIGLDEKFVNAAQWAVDRDILLIQTASRGSANDSRRQITVSPELFNLLAKDVDRALYCEEISSMVGPVRRVELPVALRDTRKSKDSLAKLTAECLEHTPVAKVKLSSVCP